MHACHGLSRPPWLALKIRVSPATGAGTAARASAAATCARGAAAAGWARSSRIRCTNKTRSVHCGYTSPRALHATHGKHAHHKTAKRRARTATHERERAHLNILYGRRRRHLHTAAAGCAEGWGDGRHMHGISTCRKKTRRPQRQGGWAPATGGGVGGGGWRPAARRRNPSGATTPWAMTWSTARAAASSGPR